MKTQLSRTTYSGSHSSVLSPESGAQKDRSFGVKTFFSLIASIAFLLQVNAQNFTIIGTGNGQNSTTGFPAPFGNYWWGARHQLFISATELTAAGIQGGSLLSSLGFNVLNTNNGQTHQNFQIKVYTTNAANPLATGYINTLQVASTTPSNVPTSASGWVQIPFVTPFNWNGSDHLVVETCFNNSSYISCYSTEWQSNLTNTDIKSRYNYADNATNCTTNGANTSTTTRPLMRIEWVPGVPCTGAPSANTVVVTPTSAICPGSSAGLNLANNYTVGGITYQWQYSNLSSVGPWTTIPTGTLSSITSPTLNAPHYFSVIITCTNSTSSVTASSGTVLVQSTTTNNVPYFEGFEGIVGPNGLPNCSWSGSNMGTTCLTYTSVQANNRGPRTGQSYASFYYSPAQSSHFWTNQIWMEAGVTYSANIWYKTESVGYLTWQLSLKVNSVQAPGGATVIATTGGAGSAVSASHILLSNTFTVGASGFYYVGVNGTSNGVCCGNYMSWDDLEIMLPCHLNPVSVGVSSSTQTICQGESVTLNATGADTYLWSNGATTGNIVVSPVFPTTYNVVGTSALTGCTTSATQHIMVNTTPIVSAISFDPEICVGESTNLQAFGADTYAWSNSTSGALISVSPTSNTTYSVTGTNNLGCSASAAVSITVNPLPVINVNSTASNDIACPEDVNILSATNGVTYQWLTSNSMLIGNPVSISPNSSTTYTVIGTDANGCEGETTYALTVTECVGLKDVSTTASGIKLYPNPNQGDFVIEIHNKKVNAVEVSDLTGRVLVSLSSSNEKINIDLSNFANGVYYVKVSSDMNPEVIKIVKQ